VSQPLPGTSHARIWAWYVVRSLLGPAACSTLAQCPRSRWKAAVGMSRGAQPSARRGVILALAAACALGDMPMGAVPMGADGAHARSRWNVPTLAPRCGELSQFRRVRGETTLRGGITCSETAWAAAAAGAAGWGA